MKYLALIILSALIDIIANILLKKSRGFKNKKYGFMAISCVILAFLILAYALHYIPLSVAYSTWGAIGILGTCLGGYILYNEKLNKVGLLGLCAVISAIILLNF